MNASSGSGVGMRSDTMYPLKNLTQSLARPLDTHLERRHARSRDGGHLFVAQSLDVVEQKRFALVVAELRQGSRHLFAQGCAVGGMSLGRVRQRLVNLVGEHLLAAAADRRYGARAVDQDAKEPRAEALTLLVPAECTVGAKEGVLHHFLRVLAVADQVDGEADVMVEVAFDEDAVRFDLTPEYSPDYGRVRRFHDKTTRRSERESQAVRDEAAGGR